MPVEADEAARRARDGRDQERRRKTPYYFRTYSYNVDDNSKMYHPFIFGQINETINQIIGETEAKIDIHLALIMKDELTIAGEKEAVTKGKTRTQNIYAERK
ncbi:hypothetical protein NPIL_161671 [Nephila pilipes]|uniref:K Homology domain-containing protein n=1 Tax=Nephila pilipes TaxID=299642 RepID=A0A8X6J6X2_NEPPI|nr:hypothetical protein NPIL_161671 [Nephila pilipes]